MTEGVERSAIEPVNPKLNVSRNANLPHSPGIRVGDYIFLSGMGPVRFVRDVETTLGKQSLDIAVAQGEAEIEPNRVLDDLGREAMAAVAERSMPTFYPIRRWLPTLFS